MARINLTEMLNHEKETQENRGRKFARNFYFKKNGRNNALVKFLLNSTEDIPVFTTHTVQKISKSGKRFFQEVDCMGEDCPLCNYAINNPNGTVSFRHDKIVIPLVNFTAVDKDGNVAPAVEYWTRSAGFFSSTILPFAERFNFGGYIEIQKNGSGKQTTYTLYPVEDKFEGRPLEPVKSVDEYIKIYNTDIESDLKSIVQSLSDNELSAIIGGGAGDEMPFGVETNASANTNTNEVPVRRNTHGF